MLLRDREDQFVRNVLTQVLFNVAGAEILSIPGEPTMTNPEWNSADLRASLLAQWKFLHDHARQVFLKDGTHVEILFILAEDGTTQPGRYCK